MLISVNINRYDKVS